MNSSINFIFLVCKHYFGNISRLFAKEFLKVIFVKSKFIESLISYFLTLLGGSSFFNEILLRDGDLDKAPTRARLSLMLRRLLVVTVLMLSSVTMLLLSLSRAPSLFVLFLPWMSLKWTGPLNHCWWSNCSKFFFLYFLVDLNLIFHFKCTWSFRSNKTTTNVLLRTASSDEIRKWISDVLYSPFQIFH